MSPIRPNVIWAMDFQFDTTADGRTVKMLNVIDEFTREPLAIDDVGSRYRRRRCGRCLGSPGPQAWRRRTTCASTTARVRCAAVHDSCRFNCAGSLFTDPGSLWQNAWIESFDGRIRAELLNAWRFDSLLEARVFIEDW